MNDYLPYFIYAFNEMGKLGVGKRINGERATFYLNRVASEGRVVYDGYNRVSKTLEGGLTYYRRLINPSFYLAASPSIIETIHIRRTEKT
ncbi:MAG: hypothetical protein ACYDH8_15210 [Syntrophales bacterium]